MSMSNILPAVINIVIAGLIFWVVMWFVDYVKVPEPFNKVIKVVAGLAALIYVVQFLLGMAR